ncbi:TonB-dependent receptor domain-containing protein [Campylobacter geochelonis]|uniref:TonB-dependent receptor domain-containing protein n=1 Tax=Campylobacter geochelonis TaxID=1780362 RepID=UPI000770A58E|nr:TonB-dependent receptor [Campylobacter geochelonis]CZE50429.1 TonB-dependent heme/hemoglobin receptor [Campylobacter geochelonis]
MGKRYLSVCASVFLLSTSLIADEKVNLDTIEVSSSSIGYNNVDAYKISTRNAEMARDILRDIPGVYIGGTNSFNQKIYMRGVNDRGLNITIDGARQRGNVFHHGADLVLDTDLLKKIDVSTGVNSVVANSGALGGSVAFKTVDASDLLEDGQVFGGKVKTGFNSNDDRISSSLALYGKISDTLELLGYVKYSDYNYGEDGHGNDIAGKGHDVSYLFKAGYSFGDSHKITLSTEHNEYKGLYPFRPEFGGTAFVDTGKIKAGERNQALLPQKMQRDTHRLNYTYNPNEFVDLDLNLYYTDHSIVRSKLPSLEMAKKAGKASLMDGGVKTYGSTLINTTKLDQGDLKHTLRYGLEVYKSISYLDSSVGLSVKGDKIVQKPNKTVGDDKATSYSVFLEDSMKIGALTMTPGVRFDYYKLDTMGEWPNRASYDFSEVSPAFALDYQFQNGIGLFGSYSKVFRGPDPIESIRLSENTAKTYKKSDALKPETGDAYEVGARYSTEFGAGHTLNFLAKYFYTDYDNLINEYASPSGVGGTTRVNAGSAKVDGVELAARGQFGNLGLGASYTHSKTKYEQTATPAQAGQAIYGGILGYSDSGDKYTFNADYYIDAADVLIGYNMIFFNSKTDKKSGYKKPAYAVHDVYATWMPSGSLKGLELNAGVYNIFDKAYYSHSQRSFGATSANDWEPGRSIRASISYKF